ncbi:MAG: M56 family metallopeptidase [Vicinamibacterales bacterium]
MTVSALFSEVAAHLWQSTIVAALVAVAASTLLRDCEARVRHAVLLAASLKFMLPFAALTALGASIGSLGPALAPMPEPIRVVLDQADSVGAPIAVPLAGQGAAAATAATIPVLPLLLAAWAAGSALVLLSWARQWRQVRRYIHDAAPLTTIDGVPVLASPLMRDDRCEPGLFGLMQPVVLIPAGIADHLAPAELAAVLVHESCHARRRDNLMAAAHSIVEAIFWFHPLVWWLGRRLREERERACDEAVIGRGVNSETYAQAILSTCRFYVESRFFAVAGVGGADLRRRVEGIVARQTGWRLTRWQRAALTTTAIAAIVTPLALGMMTTALWAQSGNSFVGLQTSATRRFDVASIKEHRSGDSGWRLGPPNRGTESIYNLQLRNIVASSFRIQDKMVFGPDWMDSVRYDIEAKGSPTANSPEVWEMMRSLLAERFHLKYHLETRVMPAYVIVVARGGHKLVKGEDGECAAAIKAGQASCDAIQFLPFGMGIRNMPVAAFAAGVARRLQDRPVVDRTGLEGRYDAQVLWRPDDATPEQLAQIPADRRPPDVNIFEAFEQQAGLRLEARREPIEVLVVDHIQRADEN